MDRISILGQLRGADLSEINRAALPLQSSAAALGHSCRVSPLQPHFSWVHALAATSIAGPLSTMILAQLGADVVKVESPEGDDARGWPPHVGDRSIVYRNMSVGKRNVVIDLTVVSDIARERQTFAESDGAPLVRLPWLVDGETTRWSSPAPSLGQYTREVLREIGLSDERIDALAASGAIREAASS